MVVHLSTEAAQKAGHGSDSVRRRILFVEDADDSCDLCLVELHVPHPSLGSVPSAPGSDLADHGGARREHEGRYDTHNRHQYAWTLGVLRRTAGDASCQVMDAA